MKCEPGRGDRLSWQAVKVSCTLSRVFVWLTPPRSRFARATVPLQGSVEASPLLPVRKRIECGDRLVRLQPLAEQMAFLVYATAELFRGSAQQFARDGHGLGRQPADLARHLAGLDLGMS